MALMRQAAALAGWRISSAAATLASPRTFAAAASPPPGGLGHPEDAAEAAASAAAASHGPSPSTPGVSAEEMGDYSSILPQVVVFGGNGYVGSRVCQEALSMGVGVASINRSGRPKNLRGDWVDRVNWIQGDALDPAQPWREHLTGALGVVSTLGAFGSNDFMYKVCGTANIRAMEAARQAGVPRFSFISVHNYKLPYGWQAQQFLLRGYFQGKRDAEARLAEIYPDGGVALRPGAISGTRQVGTTSLPLGLIFKPMKAVLSLLPARSLSEIPVVGAAFVPPVTVEAVAKAAVSAVLDPSVPPGLMDVWEIMKYEQ